ncbi:MAG TPA: 3-oxoacyl-[acyl-carrier-protein] synthase III C-terminal domain-containing protein [Polyangiaceae bacterium]|nr:3-oxoacyl-[acyl-carrier-protein] synthase III C-terminal domain-containing protein [Polyangiaceae bacterium]
MRPPELGASGREATRGRRRRSSDAPRDGHAADAVWTPRSDLAVRVLGAGGYVPPHAVTAGDMARAFPGWSADQIVEKTGIVERRFLWRLDVEQGRAVPTGGTEPGRPAAGADMAEAALTGALRMADVRAGDLDMLVVVTCTPDQPRFSHDAMVLQRRLGIRKNAQCFVVDSGCGGALYLLDMVARMLETGAARTAAIVGTHFTSAMIDRSVYGQEGPPGHDGKTISPYFSTYVFGDGAGAVVVRAERGSSLGIRTSIAGNDSRDLVRAPGGGTFSPPYGERYKEFDHAFIINGRLVALSYLETMASCMEAVTGGASCSFDDVSRFYLHQPNARVLAALADRLQLREDQVASNVAQVGNTSSAGMFILLADDLEQGRITLGSGAPVVLAAIGAGVHYGAQLVRI